MLATILVDKDALLSPYQSSESLLNRTRHGGSAGLSSVVCLQLSVVSRSL